MLDVFNEGHLKGYYCMATTVLEIEELENTPGGVEKNPGGLDIRGKSSILHSLIDGMDKDMNIAIKQRK